MIELAVAFFLTKYLFFNQGTGVFFCYILILLLVSLRYGFFFQIALLSLCVYSLEQCFFFPLSSFLMDVLPGLSYPCGLAQTILAVCFGLFSTLITAQRIAPSKASRLILLTSVLLFMFNINRFAFSGLAFNLELLAVALSARLAVSTKTECALAVVPKIGVITTILLLAILSTLIINRGGDVKVLVVQEKNAWATDDVPYNDSDWTLKSAYSYSLLYELMANHYDVKKTDSLASADLAGFDALFFMTPTKSFSAAEKAILDDYLGRGGKLVFIADHTDLYGHARAINSFTRTHGITVRYDAVFAPHDKHAKALLGNFFYPRARMMTSSSISLGRSSAVLAFCHNFISENADYTRPNFFAEMMDTPDDRYGTFPLVTVTKVGNGSIVLCSESTVFSNFAIFQPNILELLVLLFCENGFASTISKYSVLLIALAGVLLWRGRFKPSIMIPAALILLIIASRAFYFYQDRTLDFYDRDNMLVIEADDRYIFEPYFEHIDTSNTSCSYLFSAIPRYGIYPYYAKGDFMEPKTRLFVGEYQFAEKLGVGQKLLATTPCKEQTENVAVIPNNLSDYRLGNWWSQIGVSPYRKDRVKSFADWIRSDRPIPGYKYPLAETAGKTIKIELRNDQGAIKIIEVGLDAVENLAEGDCLLIGDGIWALKSKTRNDMVLVGGDSFNDRRNADFFSRYWFGVIPGTSTQ